MRTLLAICAVLFGLCLATACAATETDSTEILIKVLIRKGIITQQDADEVRAEIERIRNEEEASRTTRPVTGKQPIRASGYIQERYMHSGQEGVVDSFETRRARVTVAGDATDKLSFKLQWELAGSRTVVSSVDFPGSTVKTTKVSRPIPTDAFLEHKISKGFKITAGQFYIPFSMESLTPNTSLDLINRPLVVEALVPGRDTGDQGRDVGAQLARSAAVGRQGAGQVDFFGGLFNGSGMNTADVNGTKDPALRIVYKFPAAGFSFGGSYFNGTVGTDDSKRRRAGVETALDRGAWALKGEYIWADDEDRQAAGWYATLLCRFSPKLEGVIRLDQFDPNDGNAGDAVRTLTAGLNWNFNKGGYSRLQMNYERR